MREDSLLWLHDTEPSEAHSPTENRESRSNMRPPYSVICERSDDEEDYGLEGE